MMYAPFQTIQKKVHAVLYGMDDMGHYVFNKPAQWSPNLPPQERQSLDKMLQDYAYKLVPKYIDSNIESHKIDGKDYGFRMNRSRVKSSKHVIQHSPYEIDLVIYW